MNLSIVSFARLGRGAAAAAAIGAVVLAAAPSFAAGGPSMNFGIQIPGGPSMQMGVGQPGFHPHPHPVCLSDGDIVGELSDAGWRHVQIGNDLPHFRVMAYANWQWHHDMYQMVVDRCSGNVGGVSPVNYPHPGPGYPHPGPGYPPPGPGYPPPGPGYPPPGPGYPPPPPGGGGVYYNDPNSGMSFGFGVNNPN